MNDAFIKRSNEDLIEQLQEQHYFLKKSCQEYDHGNQKEAKRIALCLRVLLHDTKNSKSILEQLNIKNRIKFLDTAFHYNEKNLAPSCCLTIIHISNESDMALPLLTEYKNFSPEHKSKNFSCWWEQIVLDDRKHQFSRKDIILLATDKDGGAHVDATLPKEYYELTRCNSIGIMVHINGHKKPLKDFYLASIRQIGFEVDTILDDLRIDLWQH